MNSLAGFVSGSLRNSARGIGLVVAVIVFLESRGDFYRKTVLMPSGFALL
jgi:hypothetical protein